LGGLAVVEPSHRRADPRIAFVGRPSRWHRPCTGSIGCAGPALSRPKGGVREAPQRSVATTLHFGCPPTVQSSTILRRTPAGEAELAAPAQGLSLTQRRFLTLLDTSSDVGQMRLRHAGDPEKFDRDLARLAQMGLVACETPPAAEVADAVTGTVRLGAPRFARRLPLALLPIVAGALAWMAWQHLAPPSTIKHGDGNATSPSRAAVLRAPAADTPEPAPIATRTLRSDPVERPRGPKEAQAAKAEPRNTEPKAAAEPAGIQALAIPASDHAGKDNKAAAMATGHGEAALAETRLVQDTAPAKTPDIAKPVPLVDTTSPAATPTSSTPAAAAAPAAAIPSAPGANGTSNAPTDARSSDSLPIQIASAAPAAGLLRSAPTPRLVPIVHDTPDFPREAITLGLATGNVKARLTIDAKGNVSSVDIVEASHRAFDRAVRDALARWRFEPGSAGRTTTVDVAFKRD
jgi:periplasmic protein TonB